MIHTQKDVVQRVMRLPATPAQVWDALTNPEKTQQFVFNCRVQSIWQPGSPITWSGHYEGYESGERGIILACDPPKRLKYTSFDPNFGLADVADNYLHITYDLVERENQTELYTMIENFNGDDQRMLHVAKGWDVVVLAGLERLIRNQAP